MDTVEKIQSQINHLPEPSRIEVLKFIEFLNYKQHVQKLTSEKCYDFSDLLGRLQWQGNALNEQHRLRDEW
jgi:hypothetical protein